MIDHISSAMWPKKQYRVLTSVIEKYHRNLLETGLS